MSRVSKSRRRWSKQERRQIPIHIPLPMPVIKYDMEENDDNGGARVDGGGSVVNDGRRSMAVRDFHRAKREEDIGYYARILESAFMVGRALTSIMWGVAADHYGRRPIILIGVFSVVVFNTLFELSSNFWMAVTMRFTLGSFNSLLGTIKAYASEICNQEHRALALSVVSTSRGIGLVIGPAIGGFFVQVMMPLDKERVCVAKYIEAKKTADTAMETLGRCNR